MCCAKYLSCIKLTHLGHFLHLGEVGEQRDRAFHLRVTFLCTYIKNPIFDHIFQETETKLVWPYLVVFWLSKDDSAGHSAR